MTARLGWKKLQGQATGLFRRRMRRGKEQSAEAKRQPDTSWKVAIVAKRVIRSIPHPLEVITDRLVYKGKRALNEVIDERLAEIDQAASRVFQRDVAGVAIVLWGVTTAASISLVLSAAVGGQPTVWLLYMLIVSGVVGLWNVATLFHYIRLFRQLEGDTQKRILMLVASKIGVRGIIIIAVPVAALLALGIGRLLLPIP